MCKHKAEIGSISYGTMRDEDLIPRFLNHIQWLDPERITKLRKDGDWAVMLRYLKRGETVERAREMLNRWDMSLSEMTNDLFEILQEYAPPYCYFGSSEGDGADYGFWPYRWNEIKHDTEALIVSDLSEVPRKYRGEIFEVTDHGNLSLYVQNSKGKLREVWAIV